MAFLFNAWVKTIEASQTHLWTSCYYQIVCYRLKQMWRSDSKSLEISILGGQFAGTAEVLNARTSAAKQFSESAVHRYPQDHVIWALSGVRTIDYQSSIKVRGVWWYKTSGLSGILDRRDIFDCTVTDYRGRSFSWSIRHRWEYFPQCVCKIFRQYLPTKTCFFPHLWLQMWIWRGGLGRSQHLVTVLYE